MKHTVIALCLFAAPAFAQCPPPTDITARIDQLVSEARAAPNEMAGREISDKMWQLWLVAPDEPAQELLDAGMRARTSYDYLAAIDAFSKLIDYCPAYAEGYNQRAFIRFLTQDYEAALDDLDAGIGAVLETCGGAGWSRFDADEPRSGRRGAHAIESGAGKQPMAVRTRLAQQGCTAWPGR